MLKGVLAFLIFGLIFIVIIALVVLRFIYKGYRSVRDVQEEILNNGGKRFSRGEYIRTSASTVSSRRKTLLLKRLSPC